MHVKFGVHEWLEANTSMILDLMTKYLQFRMAMVQEEVDETNRTAMVTGDAEEVVDGLIDYVCLSLLVHSMHLASMVK